MNNSRSVRGVENEGVKNVGVERWGVNDNIGAVSYLFLFIVPNFSFSF